MRASDLETRRRICSPVVLLRPTTAQDLPLVLQIEAAARQGSVLEWTRERHLQALQDPSWGHRMIMAEGQPMPVGYLILSAGDNRHRSVELTRLVVEEKGGGHGRAALRLVKAFAFDELGAHRLWLDVFEGNRRARSLYESEGFVTEGTLRECILRDGRFDTLVVLSLLEAEYRRLEGR